MRLKISLRLQGASFSSYLTQIATRN